MQSKPHFAPIIVVYFYAYTEVIYRPRAQTGSIPIRLICKLKPPKTQCFRGFGVPGAIRTRGVPLRRRALYPTEVRRHMQFLCAPLEQPKEFLGGECSILLSYGDPVGNIDILSRKDVPVKKRNRPRKSCDPRLTAAQKYVKILYCKW